MMKSRRISTVALRSVIVATGVVGVLVAFGSAGNQNSGAALHKEITASSVLNNDIGQSYVELAELSLPEAIADASITRNISEAIFETASTNSPDVPLTEPMPMQIAMENPSNVEPVDASSAVTRIQRVSSVDIVDDCLIVDICVDRYLWALYQRTPKEDSIKELERRTVTVRRKGKMVTVAKTFTKLVDEDFGWKDPKAAERAGMSMMDYVIGGMDRTFKLKLFHILQAAEAAGLSPGITSAFRDDYRQSIASGLKAASNRSYHGGSSRGGYGHGLAADIVSVDGGTRDERWASSEKLWKWVDTHGKEFGIGRPYLSRDPPHVAPVDGQEYAAHNRSFKQARSDLKKVKRVAIPDSVPRSRVATGAKVRTG